MGRPVMTAGTGGVTRPTLIKGSQIQLVNKGNLGVPLVAFFRVHRATSLACLGEGAGACSTPAIPERDDSTDLKVIGAIFELPLSVLLRRPD
jgi:hypothetical protein